jgi:hypothetical protein
MGCLESGLVIGTCACQRRVPVHRSKNTTNIQYEIDTEFTPLICSFIRVNMVDELCIHCVLTVYSLCTYRVSTVSFWSGHHGQ